LKQFRDDIVISVICPTSQIFSALGFCLASAARSWIFNPGRAAVGD
jgi:hypothetical protein